MSGGQINSLDEIVVDNFAGGGHHGLVRANLPEWCGEEITTMAQLEKVVAV